MNSDIMSEWKWWTTANRYENNETWNLAYILKLADDFGPAKYMRKESFSHGLLYFTRKVSLICDSQVEEITLMNT